ncbi:hypothetical protein ES703_80171 [subsurface metagenome]
MLLERLDVNLTDALIALGRHRRRYTCGIALVLNVRLHAYNRHCIAVGTDTKSCN